MRKEVKVTDIVLVIVLLTTIIINIILCTNLLNKDNNTHAKNKAENNNIQSEDTKINELQSMGERERMEYYFAQFIDYIENNNYEQAYNLLYPEFRENYFPTLDKFKEYVVKLYPEFASFTYKDIQRQGTIYVLNIDIIDVDNKENNKSQRIVVQEYDFNNFVISFQVI